MNASSAKSARVLVVEDDVSIRETLVDILDLNGFEIIQASTGTDGLAAATRQKPDIILTDVSMPGMTGFELIKALRSDDRTRAIPVIIISASVEPEKMRAGMNLGAEDFIVKPFTEDQVLNSIHARLEKKGLLDELDAFAHTVAHDLKNPIAVISGRAELLRMTWDTADDAALLKNVRILESNALRLSGIVDELLTLAGVRKQKVDPAPVDMAKVAHDSLERVDNLIQASGAVVEKPDTWPTALGHAPWISEIWANYLSNAVKYGGKPPLLRLGCDRLPDQGRIRFWLQDNGAGLSPEQLGQLFREFSRISDSKEEGHGLGLSIVRRIAEKLGGAAGADSKPGEGSRFWFELPEAK